MRRSHMCLVRSSLLISSLRSRTRSVCRLLFWIIETFLPISHTIDVRHFSASLSTSQSEDSHGRSSVGAASSPATIER